MIEKEEISNEKIKWAFFGTSEFSVYVLEALAARGLIPSLLVTAPDAPRGRGLQLSPSPAKVWALAHNIKVFEPAKLDSAAEAKLAETSSDVFVVASYGKIIPANIFNIPKHKTLNIHPSLLPKYRGSSPIQSVILDGVKETGVTIMSIDEKMDHGPILVSQKISLENASGQLPDFPKLEKQLANDGANLLASVLPKWLTGETKATPQEETKATYTNKISKEDGLIAADVTKIENVPAAEQYEIYKKIQAFKGWPGSYFFTERNGKRIRVLITKASWQNNNLKIERVILEGKKETDFGAYL